MSATPFDPGAYAEFVVEDHHFDETTRTLRLNYGLIGPDAALSFTEEITFLTAPADHSRWDPAGFSRAVTQLHRAAGVSYYKVAAPPMITIRGSVDPDDLVALGHLYDEGLREFAVTNGLPVPRNVEWRASGGVGAEAPAPPGEVTNQLLVPIGGGKDSMVLIEAARPLAPTLFAVNPRPVMTTLADLAGRPMIEVRRRLDPQLGELNTSGALNGHVPITAIVSLIAVAGSFLYGYDTIAMAVERSASEETVMVGGVSVNHQYSKSQEFEAVLASWVSRAIDPSLTIASGLRPYSELAIARAFASMTRYHSTFCSCNSVFRLGNDRTLSWCGNCPKCRFVALMLAPWMTPEDLTAMFRRDLFDDGRQVAGFAALMSDDDKPFECVGERRESAVAMSMLGDRPEWRDRVVVSSLVEMARNLVGDDDLVALMTPASGDFPRRDLAEAVARTIGRVP